MRAIGAGAFALRGQERYGIDFTGGLLQHYRVMEPVSTEALRKTLTKVGLGSATIQQFGPPTEWLIRTADDTEAEIEATTGRVREALRSDYDALSPELVRVERVGPTVGVILQRKAWFAIAWSMVGILLYVAVRFKHWDFGAAGVMALIHDVIVAAGVFSLAGRQIEPDAGPHALDLVDGDYRGAGLVLFRRRGVAGFLAVPAGGVRLRGLLHRVHRLGPGRDLAESGASASKQ
jgi:preprotein translocase subunit SecF